MAGYRQHRCIVLLLARDHRVASVACLAYVSYMSRHHEEAGPLPDPVTKKAMELTQVLGERSHLGQELLIALANALAAHEKTQRKFRNAVLISLSRIEATVQSIHALQIVQSQKWEPGFEDKIKNTAKASEEFIARNSDELRLKMINYIYGESEEQKGAGARHGRKRQWSDWEI